MRCLYHTVGSVWFLRVYRSIKNSRKARVCLRLFLLRTRYVSNFALRCHNFRALEACFHLAHVCLVTRKKWNYCCGKHTWRSVAACVYCLNETMHLVIPMLDFFSPQTFRSFHLFLATGGKFNFFCVVIETLFQKEKNQCKRNFFILLRDKGYFPDFFLFAGSFVARFLCISVPV